MQMSVRRGLAVVTVAGFAALAGCPAALADASTTKHSLPDDSALADAIATAPSAVDAKDQVFVDGYGRQAILRGYAVSGSTKLVETGLLPFKNPSDAAASFAAMRDDAGSDLIRFQILWEGAQPKPGAVDTAYLDKAIAQIREATKRGLRVILEYHQDLQSRYLFRQDSWYTGEGMPDWVISGLGLTGKEYCGIACVTWAQAQLTDNSGVRPAAQAFWNNQAVAQPKGTGSIGVQDAFIAQAKQTLRYLHSQLSGQAWNRIVGFEPANEPIDGGMQGLSPQQWDTQKLWPFYHAIRDAMDHTGWQDKLEFAEPNVFWNSEILGVPALGSTPDPQQKPKIVFTPHYYDAARQLPSASQPVNGSYLKNFDLIRTTARQWHSPALVSEFGAATAATGATDTARELTGMYQGLNSDNATVTETAGALDDYAPVLSGTQWHWDLYRDHHHEYQNGNPKDLKTAGDAWNSEDYSVIERDDAGALNPVVDPALVSQAHPEAVQGGLLNFEYNTTATDASGNTLDWLTLCPGDGTCYLGTTNFAFQAWQGRASDAPTETFLPHQFDPENTVVITDTGIYNAADLPAAPANRANEVVLRAEPHSTAGGRQLLYWTDPPAGKGKGSGRHFLLIVSNAPATLTAAGYPTPASRQAILSQIQSNLIKTVNQQVNPVQMTGTANNE